jgi:hypothetical protein
MKEKNPLVTYRDVKQESGTDMHIEQYNSHERTVLTWFKLGTWTLRGKSRDAEKGKMTPV